MPDSFEILIVGSGLAGLTTALHLADQRRVGIITKRRLLDGASDWAQGGIAAVLAADDSIEAHVQDTLIAGAGLCDAEVTRHVVSQGREAIQWLIEQGVPFTRDADNATGYHLTREGGHSQRRVIHAADATGHAVQTTLVERVKAHPNITLFEDHIAIDLITDAKLNRPGKRCYGLYALDKSSGRVLTFSSQHTVRHGGAGKVYTTNPDVATGDGLAMGWRAAGWRIWNSFSFIRPVCIIRMPNRFSSPKRYVVKGVC